MEATASKGISQGTVLLVDDEPSILRAFSRVLGAAGFAVHTAPGGREAVKLLQQLPVDAILSDIEMRDGDGIGFLRAVRERDADMPFLLMTGSPAIETAVEAVAQGAVRYLLKPLATGELLREVAFAVRMHKMALAKAEAFALLSKKAAPAEDKDDLGERFSRALQTLWMAFQPIVSWSQRRAIAYEALVRNEEPSLVRPDHLFDAAEKLGRMQDLGRAIRAAFVASAHKAPPDASLFLNLHPGDLEDEQLYAASSPLTAIASRVVLEITERASLSSVRTIGEKLTHLRALGFRVALDDLGAGYAGLTSFAQLEPEVVKIDMSLVRACDREPTKQKLLRTFIELCAEMKKLVVCEGVETREERDTLVSLGGDIFQGYLFARPGKPMPEPVF